MQSNLITIVTVSIISIYSTVVAQPVAMRNNELAQIVADGPSAAAGPWSVPASNSQALPCTPQTPIFWDDLGKPTLGHNIVEIDDPDRGSYPPEADSETPVCHNARETQDIVTNSKEHRDKMASVERVGCTPNERFQRSPANPARLKVRTSPSNSPNRQKARTSPSNSPTRQKARTSPKVSPTRQKAKPSPKVSPTRQKAKPSPKVSPTRQKPQPNPRGNAVIDSLRKLGGIFYDYLETLVPRSAVKVPDSKASSDKDDQNADRH